MALQLKQEITFKLSQDSGTNPKKLLADFVESFTDTTDQSESATYFYTIADATSDEQVQLGSVASPKGLAIVVDQAIKLKLNDTDGTSREIILVPNKLSVLHAEFSAIYLTNDTGSSSSIRVAVWGD